MSEKKIELLLLALVELGSSPPHKRHGKQPLPYYSFSYFQWDKGKSAYQDAGMRKREAHSEKTVNMQSDYTTDYCKYGAGVLDLIFK